MFTCTCGRYTRTERPTSGGHYGRNEAGQPVILDPGHKCPFCDTFPMLDLEDGGHEYRDYDGENRCIDCDVRSWSHRLYPGDWGYEATIAEAAQRAEGRDVVLHHAGRAD